MREEGSLAWRREALNHLHKFATESQMEEPISDRQHERNKGERDGVVHLWLLLSHASTPSCKRNVSVTPFPLGIVGRIRGRSLVKVNVTIS